jgi:hypothetical protein
MAEEVREGNSPQAEDLESSAVLVIVQFPNMVVIGKCNGDMMFNPRLVGRDPNGATKLLPLMFTPQNPMYIGSAFCFSYQPGEHDPIRATYFTETTGISLSRKIITPGQGQRPS